MKGIKKYEYRKSHFKYPLHFVYLYETSPVQKVTAAFRCKGVIYGNPLKLWNQTHKHAGITKKDYFNYYANSKSATAIKIGHVYQPQKPLSLSHYGFKHSPMSYYYLK